MKKVLVTRPIPESSISILKKGGLDIVQQQEDRAISREELLQSLPDVQGALVMLTEKVDEEVLATCGDDFRIFANFAVGYDNLPLPLLTKHGIYATNTPDVLTDSTADLAWALILATARQVVPADRDARNGDWPGWGPLQYLGTKVSGRTLGIIGSGRIGCATARRALGFGMKVLYTPGTNGQNRPALEAAFPAGQCSAADVDQIIAEADFISIHTPLNDQTRHLISRERLAAMKSVAILVNTGRGPLIDEEALMDALEEGQIAGAGLDVFEQEPFIPERLRALPNAVLLPHIGSADIETRQQMGNLAAESIVAALRGEIPPRCLNPSAR